jgi:hypothetical protein
VATEVEWAYQIIQEYGPRLAKLMGLEVPQDITVQMKDMDHPAENTPDGKTIYLDPDWFAAHPLDSGAIIHELTHAMITQAPGDVGSTSDSREALADFARYLWGMNYEGWEPKPETVQMLRNYEDDPTYIQKVAAGQAGIPKGFTAPVRDYSTGQVTDYGKQKGVTGDTPEANMGDVVAPQRPGFGGPPPSPNGDISNEVNDTNFLWVSYAVPGVGAMTGKWYGPQDPRNELSGGYPAKTNGGHFLQPEMVEINKPDGTWDRMTWEEWQQAYPDQAAGGVGGGPSDGSVKPGDKPVDPPGRSYRDIVKEIMKAQGGGSQKFEFYPLEPTRRQAEGIFLQSAADMYFQMRGSVPPPGYLEKQMEEGKNFYEIFDAERAKPAFRHTKMYRDQYSSKASAIAQALGMR